MPCVYEVKLACHKVQHSLKGSYEKSLAVGFAEKIVNLGEYLSQISARLGVIFYESLAYYHKQRRRNSFARNVCHNYGKVAFIHHKEIVKVPSDLLGRSHGCIDFKFISFRECREYARQHRGLNVTRHVKLCSYTFFFRCHFCEVFYVFIYVCFHLENTACK